MHSTPSVWLGLRMGPPVFHTHAPQPRKHPQTSLQPQGIKAAFKPQFILCPLLFALAFTISWSTLETALGKSLENDTWEPRGWKETILGALVRIRDYIRNGKHFKSRIKETWKLNGTRRWQSTPYPEQVRWESWTVAHIHSGLTLLLVNPSASFFLPSYCVPKLFVLFLSLSFHFHFSFSIIECFCFLLFPFASLSSLICAIPSPSRKGGEPTSFSPRLLPYSCWTICSPRPPCLSHDITGSVSENWGKSFLERVSQQAETPWNDSGHSPLMDGFRTLLPLLGLCTGVWRHTVHVGAQWGL